MRQRRDKTRQAVLAAFNQLLFERGFAGFTVADVADRAEVGRSTLYEHFRTKRALLAEALAGPMSALASSVGGEPGAATLVPLVQHFRDNQALARILFLPPTRSLLSRVLTDRIQARLTIMCEGDPAADPMLPLPLIAAYLAEAQFAIIEPWTLGRLACRPEEIARALVAGANGAAAALLRIALRGPDGT